ncbi:MAG: PorV/PorQ family protein [bacterium]
MKKITLYLLPMFAILLSSPMAFSQKVGSSSMQFLKVMPCARATALGDAYSVWATGAEAVFWNPAGVALSRDREISLTYLNWIFDTRQGALSFATSLGSLGSVGLQVQYVDFGEIQEALWTSPYKDDIEFPGLTGKTFRPFAYLIGLSYAQEITDKFATGLTVKYAHESLYDGGQVMAVNSKGVAEEVKTWANGVLFDFGLRYNTGFRSVQLAASVQNFGANVKYASESNSIPMALRTGIAADLMGRNALLMESDDNRFSVAFDLFQPNDYAQQAHLGMEYEFAGMVALRVGNKFNYDADGFSAGCGIKQSLGATRFSFDYSYGALNYNLGNVHRISLGVGF